MDELSKIQEDFSQPYVDANVNLICRLCLEKNTCAKNMYHIFEAKLPFMIMSFAQIQITLGDGLPNSICQKCFTKLNIAWQFKLQCENSDSKLRHFYSNASASHNIEDFSADLTPICSSYDTTMPPFSSLEIEETALTNPASNNNNVEPPKSVPDKPKIHQCETCGKIFNRKEYLAQHIRIHTGEKPFNCLICDKRFINSGHLSTHMRTHTGLKPHPCSLCTKAFSTKQELQKHSLVHSGEKPFLCSMCERQFSSSSNLYSHMKYHTGEKNFTCENCGKLFYTKHELKQHFVTHTGERRFVCEMCPKKYSQLSHLRRHSKVHKNVV